MNQNEFYSAGFKVFGLHGMTGDMCGCGYDKCEAFYKHPIVSNWQHTPHWSQEQFETMHEMGQFDTGFGILCEGYLVIDVDERNGGIDSFQDLCRDLSLDLFSLAGLAVATGSGGGSMHLFFKLEGSAALMGHHKGYPGIDFKSSGFVVGAGSLHKSGNKYEVMNGSPGEVDYAPPALLQLLKKPDTHRVTTALGTVDMTTQEIIDVLAYIDPDCDYDKWIRCGMAIHDALSGTGIEVWDDWSKNGKKYTGYEAINRHWQSFGKSSSTVSAGTLIFYAEEEGYKQEVTFENDVVFEEEPQNEAVIDTVGVDLKRPPGFVGELVDWINNQCLYPRESLAVAAALTAVGSIAGMRCIDEQDGMTGNIFSFCVAGSSTGKDAVMKAYGEILQKAGVVGAMHGAIKSEQEIIRNLTRNQAAFYCIDELGIVLRKIMNAGKGGASYLEGVIGLIMSAYSKADSFLPVSGDVKHDIKNDLMKELAKARKKVDENDDKMGLFAASIPSLEHLLNTIDQGIMRPFLSILGFTTPVTFNELMEYESATNGFLARAMIFEEANNNPKRKQGYRKQPMSDGMTQRLANLYAPGYFSTTGVQRVEFIGEQEKVKTDANATKMMDNVYQYFWEMAEEAQSDSGLESIPRRGYELVAKVSFILALQGGLRTSEHVRWAFALVKNDIERKMRMAYANINEKISPSDAIAVKIQGLLSQCDEPQTEGVIVNRCRPHKKEDIVKILSALVKSGKLERSESTTKRKTVSYKIK
jgi:hypothetical protein